MSAALERARAQAEALIAALRAAELRVTTAESCTGGLISALLTEIPGASDAFDYGFVTYANAAKTTLLGVPEEMIHTHGAVSEPVATQMAQGARLRAGADLALAVSGVAGPGGSASKPEGMVCFGFALGDETHRETQFFGPLGRSTVREEAAAHALARGLALLRSQFG